MTRDIFGLGADVLVNPVNCVGVSGAGLALKFKRRFPLENVVYQDACNSGRIWLGNPLAVFTDQESPKAIVYFPTKNHWRDTSQLEHIKRGLRALVELVEGIGFLEPRTIAIPALGCGLGGLNWKEVQPLIMEAAEDLMIYTPVNKVYVLPPYVRAVEGGEGVR